MTVDTKTQEASTTAITDAVSGSIQGIFLFFDAAMYRISLSMCAHS